MVQAVAVGDAIVEDDPAALVGEPWGGRGGAPTGGGESGGAMLHTGSSGAEACGSHSFEWDVNSLLAHSGISSSI